MRAWQIRLLLSKAKNNKKKDGDLFHWDSFLLKDVEYEKKN